MIIMKMSAVAKDLSIIGLGKDKRNTFSKYDFRSIDNVYQVLSPILVKHGVVICPVSISHENTREPTGKDDTMMQFCRATVTYQVSSGIENGEFIQIASVGEGFDSGDKAMNKAMSAAYKNMVVQTFCPPFEGHSIDSESQDATVPMINDAQVALIKANISKERFKTMPAKLSVKTMEDITLKKYFDVVVPALKKEGVKFEDDV